MKKGKALVKIEIQYPTDEELEDMYKEFTRSYPEHSWIYPF